MAEPRGEHFRGAELGSFSERDHGPAASHALTDQRPHRVVLNDGATVQGRTVVVATGARYRTLNLEVLAGFAAERDVVQAGPELSRIW